VPWAIGHVNIEEGAAARATRAFMGGLTGVRSMTQPTSQRQQPRYNQRVPLIRRRRRSSHRRLGGAAFRSGVEHRSQSIRLIVRSPAAAPR